MKALKIIRAPKICFRKIFNQKRKIFRRAKKAKKAKKSNFWPFWKSKKSKKEQKRAIFDRFEKENFGSSKNNSNKNKVKWNLINKNTTF